MKLKISFATAFCLLNLFYGGAFAAEQGDNSENPEESAAEAGPESSPESIRGMTHREKSGLDDDKLNELKDWQLITLEKLTGDSRPDNPSPAFFEQKLKKAKQENNPSKLACVYLGLFSVADLVGRTSPSLGKYSPEEKEKWTALGVFSKQIIGDDVSYKISDDLYFKIIKEYSKTKCGQLARLQKIEFIASGAQCQGKEYLDVIKLGLEYLKGKNLTSPEKALCYYFLAKAYQTQWALAFLDQTADFNPQEYFSVHPQAKTNMVKYYQLLEKEVPSLHSAVDHILKRIEEKTDLGAEFDCHPEE